MERYDVFEKDSKGVGAGSYGVVYKARDKQTGQIVAFKKIILEMEEEGIAQTTLREISVLRTLKHPNVVELRDVIRSEFRLGLIFEFVERDLQKLMDETRDCRFNPEVIQSYMKQLLEGLMYCHIRGVMHRDLKPANLLISADGRTLKIADFGMARSFVPPMRPFTHEVVTLWYRPPEILLGKKTYGLSCDMWSVGCIFAQLVTKYPLFPSDASEIDQIFKIFKLFGTPTEEVWRGVTRLSEWSDWFPVWPALDIRYYVPDLCEEGIDLLLQFLVYEAGLRISAKQALKHQYFQTEFAQQEMDDER